MVKRAVAAVWGSSVLEIRAAAHTRFESEVTWGFYMAGAMCGMPLSDARLAQLRIDNVLDGPAASHMRYMRQ